MTPCSKLIAALLKVGTGKASLTTLRLLTSGLPIKITKIDNIRSPDVVFEVEYLWNGWVSIGQEGWSQRQSSQIFSA